MHRHDFANFISNLPLCIIDCQSQISLNSREAKELENNIKRLMWKGSELDNIFSIDQIYKVDNPTLERKFQEKRSELREDGRSQRELTEHLAFLIETAYHKVKDVCVNGMKCNGDDSLGDGQMGVSLWKSPDLLLKNLECPELGIVYLIVFRVRQRLYIYRHTHTYLHDPMPLWSEFFFLFHHVGPFPFLIDG